MTDQLSVMLEASDRITDIIDDSEAQMNLMSTIIALLLKERAGMVLSEEEEAVIGMAMAVQIWVREMQIAAQMNAAAGIEDFKNDDHWPKAPVGAATFMDNF